MLKYVVAGGVGLAAYAQTPLPASAYALSKYCQNVYEEYSEAVTPKAFVTGDDGSCWWWYGSKTLQQAKNNALKACRKSGAKGCRVREAEI